MPRPRTKDPLQPLLEPIARRFAAQVAAAVVSFVEARVKQEVKAAVGRAFAGARMRGAGSATRVRNIRPCRVPGCSKPSKGPRYDFFCAQHRELPAAEKAAIKAGKKPNGGKADAKPTRKAPQLRKARPVAGATAE
jgi:hypothetical protein